MSKQLSKNGKNLEKKVNFWKLCDEWFFGARKKETPFWTQETKGYNLSKVLSNLFVRYADLK